MRTNYHTHTYRCKHAGGTEEDYILAALDKNIKILGFSDHAPYPDDRFGLRMDFHELEEHVGILKDLQASYKDKITIKLGLEIEYDSREHEYYNSLFNDYGFEYLALGQHFYIDPSGEAENIYFIKDTSQYILYANSLVDGMATGLFKFIAHPDVIFINDLPWDSNCDKACDIIIQGAKKYNSILEFNANGIRRGKTTFVDGERYPYPHKLFWDKVASTDIPVIINSDCHGPEQVYDEIMETAHELAKSWGLKIIDTIF